MPSAYEKLSPDVARIEAIAYIACSGGISAGIAGAASIAYFWTIIAPMLTAILAISLLSWMVLVGIAAGIIGCLIAGTMANFLLKHTHIVNYYGSQASFISSVLVGVGGSILSLFIPLPGLGPILALEALAGITILSAFITGIVTNMFLPTGYDMVRIDKKNNTFDNVDLYYSPDAFPIGDASNFQLAPAFDAALVSNAPQSGLEAALKP